MLKPSPVRGSTCFQRTPGFPPISACSSALSVRSATPSARSIIRNSPAGGGRAAAQASFADFLTPRIVETSQYDAITDFTVCPDTFRTPSNCVMDSQFAAAVRQSKADQPLTVSDALTRGYLHGDWPLVSANGADAAKNADPFCFTTGYCYSNLVKMRKARIIPIGWELAAAKATNGSPTLQEVIRSEERRGGKEC